MNDIPLLLNPAFRLQHLGIQGSINFQLPVRRGRAKVDQLSTLSLLPLLNHFFKLSPEHTDLTSRAGTARGAIEVNKVATKRDVQPVAFFAFDDKFVGLSDVSGIRGISPCLHDYIDHQVPSSRLTCFSQCA